MALEVQTTYYRPQFIMHIKRLREQTTIEHVVVQNSSEKHLVVEKRDSRGSRVFHVGNSLHACHS